MDGSQGSRRDATWGKPGSAAHLVRLLADHIKRTGHTFRGHRVWTEEEVFTLLALYPDYAAAQKALPHRSLKALEMKIEKLGRARSRSVWTAAEVTRLKRPYTSGASTAELLELFPGKTMAQVWGRAWKSRFRRPRKPPRPTRWPVVDAVRRRAFELNLTMGDLDEMARSGSYFRRPWTLNWRHVGKAIVALGGEVRVDWGE